jgi:autotransporter-associated beta strand protein
MIPTPLFFHMIPPPPLSPVTCLFNGLHPKSNFLAIIILLLSHALGFAQAPTVTTDSATWLTTTTTTLAGTVNPCGIAATAQFEYGPTTAYGTVKPVTLSPDNGSTGQNVSVDLGTLPAGSTYHYRLTATNANGTTVGADRSFVTARTSGNYTYTTADNTAIITDYTGAGGVLSMPGTIDGLAVTAIGYFAFGSTSITSVTIPGSVTSIGDGAFYDCTGLTRAYFAGKAPTMNSSASDSPPFSTASGLTVYFLTGKTGFTSPTWLGYPAVGVADPTIITQPAPVTISSGTGTTLGATVLGTEPLVYEWFQGPSGNTTTPVGTNSASFATPAQTVTTSYWVKITNSINPTGTKSSTATVTVLTLPVTSGLTLWLDGSRLSGLSDGQQVNTWGDVSGQNNHAIRQGTSSAGYPKFVANGLNGKAVVRFNSQDANTGDFFKFNRISTIRTVFWVIKENAKSNIDSFLLGDDSYYNFHRAWVNGPLWHNRYTNPYILNGTTKLMGTGVDGTTTLLPSNAFQLISLVTTGPVQANQITQDRTAHGSWVGDIAEILIYSRALTGVEEAAVGSYLAEKYALATAYESLKPEAKIGSFGLAGSPAVIDHAAKTIAWTMPYGTNVTALAPVFTLSTGASCDRVSGVQRDFSNPIRYTVTASDSLVTAVYTVTVTVVDIIGRAWTNDGSGLWSAATNWNGGIVANGLSGIADFGSIDLTADRTVSLDSPRTIGRLIFGDTATASAAGWTVNNNGSAANILTLAGGTPTITVNALGPGKDATISAQIAGAATLTKAGAGTLTLANVNTYAGGTAIQGGVLRLGGVSSSLGTGNVSNSGVLAFNNTGTVAILNAISGSGSLRHEGPGTVLLLGTNTFTGGTVVNGGTLAVDGSQTWNCLAANSLVTLNNSGSVFEIRGVNALPVDTNSVDVTANAGTILRIVSGRSACAGGSHAHLRNLRLNGGTIDLAYSGADGTYLGESFALKGDVSVGGAAMATIQFGAGATTANAGISLNGNRTFTVNDVVAGSDLMVTAELQSSDTTPGDDGFRKTGAGTMVLTAANTYTGVTIISGGVLSVATIGNGGVAGNLGQSSNASGNLVLNGGILRYTGTSAYTDRGMTLNNVAGNGIEVTGSSATFTGSGVLTGAGGFTKSGPGILTLSFGNSYTGATVVAAGTLRLGNNTALGTATGGTTVSSGAVLDLGSRTVSAEPLTLNGTGINSGGALINSGTWGGPVTLASASSVGGTSTTTLSGMISGTGNLTKVGTSILVVAGVNTYTGDTMVSSGTLRVNGTLASGGGTVTVNSGATLGGIGSIQRAVTAADGAILTPGSPTTGALTVNSCTLNGEGTLNLVPGVTQLNITTADGLNPAGGAGSVTLNLSLAPTPGTHHLIAYSGSIQGAGFDAFKLGTTPAGFACILKSNAGFVDVEVTALLPLADTGTATAVTATTATLSGTVNPNGLVTTARFEYGSTSAYGSTATVTLAPNNGTTAQGVSANLSSLEVGAVYHYRLIATNANGTTPGEDGIFATERAFGDYRYTTVGNSATLTDYAGAGGSLVIPATLNGLPVTALGESAFANNLSLTSVTIPATVTSIGSHSFQGCAYLTSAIFLGNAPAMGAGVFDLTAPGFTVYYYNGRTGFSSQTWQGYPAVNLGDASPIETWLQTNGLPYNANLQADPNGDGVSLLMAYALNLDPRQNLSATMPRPVLAGNQMSLTFYAGNADVTYKVESSTDLKNWSSNGVSLSTPDAISKECTATFNTPGPHRFMRLVVVH